MVKCIEYMKSVYFIQIPSSMWIFCKICFISLLQHSSASLCSATWFNFYHSLIHESTCHFSI